jgi:hypothetical protein
MVLRQGGCSSEVGGCRAACSRRSCAGSISSGQCRRQMAAQLGEVRPMIDRKTLQAPPTGAHEPGVASLQAVPVVQCTLDTESLLAPSERGEAQSSATGIYEECQLMLMPGPTMGPGQPQRLPLTKGAVDEQSSAGWRHSPENHK